ncbi:MAG TPA: glycoside hydrolase family 3 N-terminal domain-containing protein, partial [Phycisphaerae bacterium]
MRRCRQLLCSLAVIGAAIMVPVTSLAAADSAPAPRKPSATDVVPPDAPYKNPALPFETRVADLVSRMTLDEKADQVQSNPKEIKRFGMNSINWWTEALHGVSRAGTATVFPQAMGMAATWDPPLFHKIADATADEARAKLDPGGGQYRGVMIWAPTINMARDPRWGRTEESYGEDPWLTSRLSIEFVKGLQGDDPKYLKTVATPKHFALHSQETSRQSRSFDCPETVLRDYYLPAFRDSFIEGKATSTMSAFSGLNKIPCTANFWLLTELLRKEWGFDGAVVTDWSAVQQLVNAQHYVDTMEEGVAAALNAGVDVISDRQGSMTTNIVSAVRDKMLNESVLDRALTRNLMLRFRLGFFDPDGGPYGHISTKVVESTEHVALALKTAQESFTLLKNDLPPKGYGFDKPLLPLDMRRIDSIAVIGPFANTNQYGAYSGSPTKAPTIVNALRDALGDRVNLRTSPANDSDQSLKAARDSDVVVFVCGLGPDQEKEGADRGNFALPSTQQSLLDRVIKTNPLTIVLLEGGSVIGLEEIKKQAPAIMMIWYPGQQGGPAVAQALLGQINPSGKLPLTFYRSAEDLPPLDHYDITELPGRTY